MPTPHRFRHITQTAAASLAPAACQRSPTQRQGAAHGGHRMNHGAMHAEHHQGGTGAMTPDHGIEHHGGAHGARTHGGGDSAGAADAAPVSFDSPPPVGTRARCPVSGEVFTVQDATPRSVHDGRHYVFCCPGCKPKFDAAPQQFISK